MSLEANITRDDRWHIGEDKKLRFPIYADADRAVCLDASGFALSWKLKTALTSGTVLLTKTSGSGIAVTGVFNADPAVNTQVVEVTIDDVDTQPDSGSALLDATTYYQELKRTDAGLEQVLAQGRVTFLPAIHSN